MRRLLHYVVVAINPFALGMLVSLIRNTDDVGEWIGYGILAAGIILNMLDDYIPKD